MSDLLKAIVASVTQSVRTRERAVPIGEVRQAAAARRPNRGTFVNALQSKEQLNVIAELKRRSPSGGVLRRAYKPASVARAYERAGAAAISVVTEAAFFDGSLDDLTAVCDAVHLPVLRKDFIVSEYQIVEAAACGATAVLLIVAALDGTSLSELHGVTKAQGLTALVEVRTAREAERALEAGADVIGVNNRDLRTMTVDPRLSYDLIREIPSDVVRVSESGLGHREDLERLREAGYDAFLIGERLIGATDPGAALSVLIGSPSVTPSETAQTIAPSNGRTFERRSAAGEER